MSGAEMAKRGPGRLAEAGNRCVRQASVYYTANIRHLLNWLRAAAGFQSWWLYEAVRFRIQISGDIGGGRKPAAVGERQCEGYFRRPEPDADAGIQTRRPGVAGRPHAYPGP